MYLEASVTWCASVRLTAASCRDCRRLAQTGRRRRMWATQRACTHPVSGLFQLLHDLLEAVVVRGKLDLARHVEDDVLRLVESFESLEQPVTVSLEVL